MSLKSLSLPLLSELAEIPHFRTCSWVGQHHNSCYNTVAAGALLAAQPTPPSGPHYTVFVNLRCRNPLSLSCSHRQFPIYSHLLFLLCCRFVLLLLCCSSQHFLFCSNPLSLLHLFPVPGLQYFPFTELQQSPFSLLQQSSDLVLQQSPVVVCQ